MGVGPNKWHMRSVILVFVVLLGVLFLLHVDLRMKLKYGYYGSSTVNQGNDDSSFLFVPDGEGAYTPRVKVIDSQTSSSFPQETMVLSLMPEEEMVSEIFWHDSVKGVARITYDPISSLYEVAISEGIPHKSRVILRIADGLLDYTGDVTMTNEEAEGPNVGMSKPTEVKYVVYNQSSEPDVLRGAIALWTNHTHHWLIWDYGGTQKKVQFS